MPWEHNSDPIYGLFRALYGLDHPDDRATRSNAIMALWTRDFTDSEEDWI